MPWVGLAKALSLSLSGAVGIGIFIPALTWTCAWTKGRSMDQRTRVTVVAG